MYTPFFYLRFTFLFSLPLIVFAETSYEPNNTIDDATSLYVNGAIQDHNFDYAGNQDWLVFYAEKGMMCQHFSVHKVTQLSAEFHNLQETNNHWLNEFSLGYKRPQYIQILPAWYHVESLNCSWCTNSVFNV